MLHILGVFFRYFPGIDHVLKYPLPGMELVGVFGYYRVQIGSGSGSSFSTEIIPYPYPMCRVRYKFGY